MDAKAALAVVQRAHDSLRECNVPPESFTFGPAFGLAVERRQRSLAELAVLIKKLNKEVKASK